MQTIPTPVMATDIREALVRNREQTLETIYKKTYPMVLHYVRQRHGTADDAQDLLQEAIILFYEKAVHKELNLTASATTYIMAVCKNRWRRELEKRNRQQELPSDISERVKVEASADTDQPQLRLTQFVDQLGEKCKAILVAFYYMGQRMEQVAAQYQYRNVRTATVQKFKCLERLRKSLASYSIHHFR
jgi:RNA polymerase sigma factor (sigma-70 family)